MSEVTGSQSLSESIRVFPECSQSVARVLPKQLGLSQSSFRAVSDFINASTYFILKTIILLMHNNRKWQLHKLINW